MKKLMMLAVAAIMTTAFFSCQSNSGKKEGAVNATAASSVYLGTIPAADGPGIVYKLTINDLKDEAGNFVLDMIYLDAEKAGENKTITQKGKLKTVKGTTKSGGDKVYQLTGNDNQVTYFLVKDDKTLRLLNEAMEQPESLTGLNYDIVLVE